MLYGGLYESRGGERGCRNSNFKGENNEIKRIFYSFLQFLVYLVQIYTLWSLSVRARGYTMPNKQESTRMDNRPDMLPPNSYFFKTAQSIHLEGVQPAIAGWLAYILLKCTRTLNCIHMHSNLRRRSPVVIQSFEYWRKEENCVCLLCSDMPQWRSSMQVYILYQIKA